ncbi:MAG: hypothetical protein PHE25_06430 [Candidatus Gracilibacteria bacterium]|nr:hypothetical protein [Candidatus Gracilibacteria bacterium]
MSNTKSIDSKVFTLLGLSSKSKVYYSNIGYILVSDKLDFVYKVYTNKDFFDKEIYAYSLFSNIDVLIPKMDIIGLMEGYYIIKLENVRKHYYRKNNIFDLNLKKVAYILSKIHNIVKDGKNFILGDVHSSNFYELNCGNDIVLGIFDFSSSRYGDIEEDIANLYIDLGLNNIVLRDFLIDYGLDINNNKLYKYTISELYERIKKGMNLSVEKKKMYYKFLIKLKTNYEN